ncbi:MULTISPECIES: hypothetical protein, partial [unclassified Bartonella]
MNTSRSRYVTLEDGTRYRFDVIDNNSQNNASRSRYVTLEDGTRYRFDVLNDASNFEETTSPQHPEITQSEAFWNSLKHGLSFNLDDEIAGITAAGRDSDDELAIKAFAKGLYNYWTG